jgi:tRNA A-37 threonylcarbamoyl transferase component Bud32
MAEAQITITYRSLPHRASFIALMVALPAFVLFAFWFTLSLILAMTEGLVAAGPGYLLFTGELLCLASMIIGVTVLSDRTIFLSRDGISLPFVLLPSHKFRSELGWSGLQAVRLLSAGQKLALFFESGNRVVLDLKHLTQSDRQQLLVALEVWTPGAEKFSDLESWRIEMGNSGQALSYTQLWEEELTRRFGATNFVPLEPGQTLQNGAMRVVRQLAFGGLSAVYLVLKDDRKFILKESVVPSEADQQLKEKASSLLNREAEMLSRLEHPFIVKVRDHFVDEGRDYLLIDYIPGTDLRQLVKEKGTPKLEQAVDWMKQIAQIVAFLHEQVPPIVHRDLTPENLVLNDEGKIMAIDFGVANEFLGTATGTMVGKQAYIAPEQLRGKSCTASDIYALGCTFHFLLTGSDPEALSVSRPSKIVAELPEWIDTLIARCTSMKAEDRPDIDELCGLLAHSDAIRLSLNLQPGVA